MPELKVVKRYTVNLPETNSGEWWALVVAFLNGDPDYAKDPENMEPQVLEGNLAFWLTSDLTFEKHPEFTKFVVFDDYTGVE